MTQGQPASAPAQGAPVDVITNNVGDTVRREQARDLGAGVVQALFRVVKAATLHAMDNQAVVRQIEETVALVNDYGARTGTNVSVLFAHGSIFVGGQLLKANRTVYDGAIELGEVLFRCGVAELTISKDARKFDIQTFASVIAQAMRGKKPEALEKPSPRVRLRAVGDAALARGMSVERLTPDQAIVRTYASAIVIMRRFYESLARGEYYLPQRLKRIAQSLVDLSSGETPAFLGVTAVRNANHDDAGRAVNTAILSLSIARQITTDSLLLVRLAMAALLFDSGRPRLVGIRPGGRPGIIPQLSDQQGPEVPAATAVVLTALGRVNEPSVMRTVMTYEAHWVKRQAQLGPPYRGLRQATIQARIIALARSFNDLLTPQPGLEPSSADEAIARLEADATEAIDRTVLRLLVGALGIFPTGTLVELSTGEVALVVATPSHPALYSQPRVRLVFAAGGGPAERVDIDLASAAPPGQPRRHIVRVVAMADEAGPEMRALAKQAASGIRAPEQPVHEPPPMAQTALTARPPQPTVPAPRPPVPPPPPSTRGGSSPSTLQSAPAAALKPQPAPSISILNTPAQQVHVAEAEGVADEQDQSTRMVEYDQAYLLAPEGQAPKSTSEPVAYVSPPSSDRVPSSGRSPVPVSPPVSAPRAAVQPDAPAVAPTATGNLTRTPLVHLLVYMLDQRLTGSTVFQSPDGTKHCVYFQDGVPSKIQTGTMVAPLDRVILDMGLLDEATLRETLLEVSKKKMLHGRHLVMKGLLDRETVVRILHEQLIRKLTSLFELPAESAYAYFEGVNLLASYGGPELTPCEPLAVIMDGIRMRAADPLVDATLDRVATRPLALHLDADVRRFALSRNEAAVVDLLRTQRMTLQELLSAGVAQARVVRLTMYALAITRHLDLGVAGRPPVGIVGHDRSAVSAVSAPRDVAIREGAATPATGEPAAPAARRMGFGLSPKSGDAGPASSRTPAPVVAPQPPASRTGEREPPSQRREASPPAAPPPSPPAPVVARGPDASGRRAEIEKRHSSIDAHDCYQLLGLQRGAAADQIQAAYFALAKTWHPDRVGGELADLKPQVSKIFAKMSDAYQTLSDASKRTAYDKELKVGGGVPDDQEKVARVMEAALEFQKAEVLVKKQDLHGAEALVRRAVSADPEQPEYITLLVWIQAQRRGDPPALAEGATSTHYDDLIKTLDAIISKEPRYERALFYRGMLLKRSGKGDKALRDFRLSAEINPKNLDAVREVRLFEMRKHAPSAPEGGGGMFSKLFKKP